MSFEDANLHREQTGVSGLMVARQVGTRLLDTNCYCTRKSSREKPQEAYHPRCNMSCPSATCPGGGWYPSPGRGGEGGIPVLSWLGGGEYPSLVLAGGTSVLTGRVHLLLGSPPSWKGPGTSHWCTLPPERDLGPVTGNPPPPRPWEGTWNQSLGYPPEGTWDQWLEVLWD